MNIHIYIIINIIITLHRKLLLTLAKEDMAVHLIVIAIVDDYGVNLIVDIRCFNIKCG